MAYIYQVTALRGRATLTIINAETGVGEFVPFSFSKSTRDVVVFKQGVDDAPGIVTLKIQGSADIQINTNVDTVQVVAPYAEPPISTTWNPPSSATSVWGDIHAALDFSSGGGSGSGVTSINSVTGAINLVNGSGTVVETAGQDLSIDLNVESDDDGIIWELGAPIQIRRNFYTAVASSIIPFTAVGEDGVTIGEITELNDLEGSLGFDTDIFEQAVLTGGLPAIQAIKCKKNGRYSVSIIVLWNCGLLLDPAELSIAVYTITPGGIISATWLAAIFNQPTSATFGTTATLNLCGEIFINENFFVVLGAASGAAGVDLSIISATIQVTYNAPYI